LRRSPKSMKRQIHLARAHWKWHTPRVEKISKALLHLAITFSHNIINWSHFNPYAPGLIWKSREHASSQKSTYFGSVFSMLVFKRPYIKNYYYDVLRVWKRSSWLSGHFHFGSLVQCPDEIWHNSAGIPSNDRLSLQWAASRVFPDHITVMRQYYFRFERNNAMEADGEPSICIE
jgi:hypothetical protein